MVVSSVLFVGKDLFHSHLQILGQLDEVDRIGLRLKNVIEVQPLGHVHVMIVSIPFGNRHLVSTHDK